MKTAETFAGLSHARRLHVGAIVVKDDRIISIGYNGMPAGRENNCEDKEYMSSDAGGWLSPEEIKNNNCLKMLIYGGDIILKLNQKYCMQKLMPFLNWQKVQKAETERQCLSHIVLAWTVLNLYSNLELKTYTIAVLIATTMV